MTDFMWLFLSLYINFVAKPELTIDAKKYHETKPIRVGDNLALECPFKNFDNFKWYKDEKLFNDQSRDIQIFNSSTSHAGKSKMTRTYHFTANQRKIHFLLLLKKTLQEILRVT